MRAPIFCLLVAASLVPFLAALAPTAQADPVKTNKVNVENNAFDPPEIAVVVGTTVTWTSHEMSTIHTVTAEDGQAETFDSPLLPEGAPVDEFMHRFDTVGNFTYFCQVHASMLGKVVVVTKFEDPIINVDANDQDRFNPDSVKLNVSQAVVWENSGAHKHSVTFEDATIGDLGALDAAQSLRHDFTKEGTFRYRCIYHSRDFADTTGMIGVVAVGPGAAIPTIVGIESPAEGAEINGTVNVTGTLRRGSGPASITAVQYRFDGGGNWSEASGIESWSFPWATRNSTNGEHVIEVRALAGADVAANDSANVVVNNTVTPLESPALNKGKVPGVGALHVGAALVAVVALRRVRRGPL